MNEWDTPLVYQRIQIPAGAPQGVYRVKLAYESRGWVIATSAKRYGVVAPEGLQLPAHSALPMYFRVPGAGRTQATVTVPPGPDGRLWSLVDSHGATVLVDGTVPVFAPGSADRFFLPEAVPPPVRPEVNETDGATTFTEGLSGRGLLVNGSDLLTLDLPPLEAGTVEFWFNPRWTSGGLTPPGTTRPLLLFRKAQPNETAALVFRQDGPLTRIFLHKGYPPSFRNRIGDNNSARWARGTWNHLAFVWDSDKNWAAYINGMGAGSRVSAGGGTDTPCGCGPPRTGLV